MMHAKEETSNAGYCISDRNPQATLRRQFHSGDREEGFSRGVGNDVKEEEIRGRSGEVLISITSICGIISIKVNCI